MAISIEIRLDSREFSMNFDKMPPNSMSSNHYIPKIMDATLKYSRRETASQIVVINGLAITAGSKPTRFASTGRMPPMNFGNMGGFPM